MKTKSCMAGILLLFLIPLALLTSCSVYDEDDATIIAYLKINDLLENKLSKTCGDKIASFEKAAAEHDNLVAAQYLNQLLGWGLGISDDDFSYDKDAIDSFYKKYYDKNTKRYDLEALEADISAELWAYINFCYTNTIPAKAQNAEEGRYYTISELKTKYSDYKDVEIEEFSPMELIRTVENETLFDLSLISDGDVNLYTLYAFYLQNKESGKGNAGDSVKEKYLAIIASHFTGGIPADFDTDAFIKLFNTYSTIDGAPYTNDLEGFKHFANDYLETDMFSGEDYDE